MDLPFESFNMLKAQFKIFEDMQMLSFDIINATVVDIIMSLEKNFSFLEEFCLSKNMLFFKPK